MSDDLDIFRHGIRHFRTGGIAVAVLPLILGVALLLAGDRDTALQLIILSLIVFFLIFWTTHCAEDVVARLKASRQDRV
jgi:hypothetical protein